MQIKFQHCLIFMFCSLFSFSLNKKLLITNFFLLRKNSKELVEKGKKKTGEVTVQPARINS